MIGTIESINSATYDPRTQSRDAITVGGSDAAGTAAAVNELVGLIERYGKQANKPTTSPTRREPGGRKPAAATRPAQ